MKPNGNGMRFLATHCPICRQRINYAHALDITAPKARWTVHCHEGAWLHITGKDGLQHVIYMTGVAQRPEQQELI